jgi:hypothetical protein
MLSVNINYVWFSFKKNFICKLFKYVKGVDWKSVLIMLLIDSEYSWVRFVMSGLFCDFSKYLRLSWLYLSLTGLSLLNVCNSSVLLWDKEYLLDTEIIDTR